MEQSESIAELSAALAKAQGEMEGAAKDSSNPFFKSEYADLSSVWDACRKPLSNNGLSVVQTPEFMPDHPDIVCLDTILCHSSGQWIKGRLAVKPVKSDPQSVGSCITYLRRYSLQSMVGIAPDDDDGNAASGKNEGKKTLPPAKGHVDAQPEDIPDAIGQPPAEKPAKNMKPKPEIKQPVTAQPPTPQGKPEIKDANDDHATEQQIKAIHSILGRMGITDAFEKHFKVSRIVGIPEPAVITSMNILTKKEASNCIEELNKEGRGENG